MRRRGLGHHSGGHDKNSAAVQPHVFHSAFVQDDQFQCFSQMQVREVAMGAMRLQIVNFGEDAAQSTNVNGLAA